MSSCTPFHSGLHPLQYYRSLKTPKGRKLYHRFLAEGPKILADLLAAKFPVEELIVDSSAKKSLEKNFPGLFDSQRLRILEPRSFAKISDTVTSQGAVAVVPIPAPAFFSQGFVLALNGIQDPGNAGTLARAAFAFGVDQFLLDQKSADPYSAKVIRSSAGAILRMKVKRCNDLIEELLRLKKAGFHLCGLDARAACTLDQWKPFSSQVLVVGSEGEGMEEEIKNLLDQEVRIPIRNVESLNAAMAANIALYSVFMSGKTGIG